MATITSPTDRLEPFSISTHAYKTVDGHDILLDLLLPKKLISEGLGSEKWSAKRPVLVRYHGGWLVRRFELFLYDHRLTPLM